jgi:hypothetical protein
MEACGWISSAANCNVTLEKVSHTTIAMLP